MDKIAAYQEALFRNELEKRASVLVERYGTCDGQLPAPYAQAFMEMEKEALLADVGKAVTGGVYRAGKAIAGAGGAGVSGSRTGLGGRMMDWASSRGGKLTSGATDRLLANVNQRAAERGLGPVSLRQLDVARTQGQQLLGGAALTTAGAGALGTGYLGYNALKNRRPNQ